MEIKTHKICQAAREKERESPWKITHPEGLLHRCISIRYLLDDTGHQKVGTILGND